MADKQIRLGAWAKSIEDADRVVTILSNDLLRRLGRPACFSGSNVLTNLTDGADAYTDSGGAVFYLRAYRACGVEMECIIFRGETPGKGHAVGVTNVIYEKIPDGINPDDTIDVEVPDSPPGPIVPDKQTNTIVNFFLAFGLGYFVWTLFRGKK